MNVYKHIFFDLDRTLWDFEKNSKKTLNEIFEFFNLNSLGIPSASAFTTIYKEINEQMWDGYRKGLVSKQVLRSERYNKTLHHFGINNRELSKKIGTYYIKESPKKTALFQDAHETLSYLKAKYQLHIITNGFEEVQHVKLKHSNLTQYFQQVITSEQVGYKKPDRRVFEHALKAANAVSNESVMIGDDFEVDVIGARNAGITGIHFNPEGVSKKDQITELNELQQLF